MHLDLFDYLYAAADCGWSTASLQPSDFQARTTSGEPELGTQWLQDW